MILPGYKLLIRFPIIRFQIPCIQAAEIVDIFTNNYLFHCLESSPHFDDLAFATASYQNDNCDR